MKNPLVFVVDDNKITVKLLKRTLESNGYDVQEAYDGIDCLEKVAQRPPDAIVLDVMMPRLDGYGTVQRIKASEETAGIPVVIVTALNDVANQLKAIEMGADDFLSKPVENKLLIAKVKMLSAISIEHKKAVALESAIKQMADGQIDPKAVTVDSLYADAGL